MTKYEWESELRKHIGKLPKDEQNRIFEYYNELFADQAEHGMSEAQIIKEFGNPTDVAFKILTDYGMDVKNEPDMKIAPPDFWKNAEPKTKGFDYGFEAERPAYKTFSADAKEKTAEKDTKCCAKAEVKQKETAPEKQGGKSLLSTIIFVAMVVVFGGVYIGVVATVWSLVFAAFAVGVSFLAGGVFAVLTSLTVFSVSTGVAVVTIGMGLVIFGLGLGILVNSKKIVQFGSKLTTGSTKLFFGWYTSKKEAK